MRRTVTPFDGRRIRTRSIVAFSEKSAATCRWFAIFGGRIRCREILYTVEDQGGVEGLVDDPGAEVQSADDAVMNAAGGDAPAKRPEQPAGDRPVLAAVICKGSRGWQWAVSQPSAENP